MWWRMNYPTSITAELFPAFDDAVNWLIANLPTQNHHIRKANVISWNCSLYVRCQGEVTDSRFSLPGIDPKPFRYRLVAELHHVNEMGEKRGQTTDDNPTEETVRLTFCRLETWAARKRAVYVGYRQWLESLDGLARAKLDGPLFRASFLNRFNGRSFIRSASKSSRRPPHPPAIVVKRRLTHASIDQLMEFSLRWRDPKFRSAAALEELK